MTRVRSTDRWHAGNIGIEIAIGFSKTLDFDSDPDALHGAELSNADCKAGAKNSEYVIL